MKLEVHLNDEKNGVELLFSQGLPIALYERLLELGFKYSFHESLKWYAPRHPAYVGYANALRQALFDGKDFLSVPIRPSFTPSEENIDQNKFSYVSIYFNKNGEVKRESYVVFDSYKKVAADIANRFGRDTYKEDFIKVEVYARKYKIKARVLLEWRKVIGRDADW